MEVHREGDIYDHAFFKPLDDEYLSNWEQNFANCIDNDEDDRNLKFEGAG